ncbi:MAG: hypothetical protein VXY34_06070 [Bdellovibrionota bacterium]|nr:hypothetical protein [Bdellovibrionota bacterium]
MFKDEIIYNFEKKQIKNNKRILKIITDILKMDGIEVYWKSEKPTLTFKVENLENKNFYKIPFFFSSKKEQPIKFIFLKLSSNGKDEKLKQGPIPFSILLIGAFICILHLSFLIWKSIFKPILKGIDKDVSESTNKMGDFKALKIASDFSQKILLLVDENLSVLNDQSVFSNQVFQGNIKNENVVNEFFSKFLFLSHELSRIESSLILSFGDDTIQFSAVSCHFPKQGTLHVGNQTKHFNFFYMPLLDDHHNVQYILISLVENTEIQTLRRIINKVKKESSIEKDILKADNEEEFLKKLTHSRNFIATQLKQINSKLTNEFDQSCKNMLFYELYKILPEAPFLKASIQNIKVKMERKMDTPLEYPDFPSNNESDYYYTKTLVPMKFVIFLEALCQISKVLGEFLANFQKAKHEIIYSNRHIYPIVEERLKETFLLYKNIFDMIEVNSNEDVLKHYKDFKEIEVESNLYNSLLLLKSLLVTLSYLFNATNNDSLSNTFHSSSDKLNLILGRKGLNKNNISVGLFEAHKTLHLKAEVINQIIKTK